MVPPIRLVYFDPADAKYKVTETPSFSLTATPGAEKESLAHVSGGPATSNQKEVRVQGEDLMPMKRELTSYGTDDGRAGAELAVFANPAPSAVLRGWIWREALPGTASSPGRRGVLRRAKAYRAFSGRSEGIVRAGTALRKGIVSFARVPRRKARLRRACADFRRYEAQAHAAWDFGRDYQWRRGVFEALRAGAIRRGDAVARSGKWS